ncbi:hypothetical protein SNOG_14628 [Parastagonospora nodorum SN15]|uniref:Uncharacterized protein n=1 Tax=Phaeosphaeria nodorum (strain SN15 / ATCC MYA-4574 / FGSC 10173) TaxID=321614 RepID=Q0U0B9_PHANO|nr:hypothetical protein SNOG_14628 [Parastagonospora nodorum SN15]EAT77820.1 hypothetical protein SNOG_14628 [Parastagonospora nodorum SN15]
MDLHIPTRVASSLMAHGATPHPYGDSESNLNG